MNRAMRSILLAGFFVVAAAPFVALHAQPEATPPAPATPPPPPAAPPAAPAATPAPTAPAPAPAAPGATSAAPAATSAAPAQPGAPAGTAAKPPANLPKGRPVCNNRSLPLVVGNQWTYIAVPPPIQLSQKEIAQLPNQPKTIIITVKDSSVTDGVTTVTLQEDVYLSEKPRTIMSTIVCSATRFDISPDSFFFAGEPGGYYGLEIGPLERKGTTWAVARGALSEVKWREDIVLQWKRVGSAGSGKLEMEREFIPEERAVVGVPYGTFRAEPVAISVTGRVTVDGAPADAAPYPFKAPMIDRLWFAEGVGIVQVHNSFPHAYMLSTALLAK
jgi:hypothetical protein